MFIDKVRRQLGGAREAAKTVKGRTRAKTELLAMMSHAIPTPPTSMMGFAQLPGSCADQALLGGVDGIMMDVQMPLSDGIGATGILRGAGCADIKGARERAGAPDRIGAAARR
ncbi:signal transduction histidine kinase [Oxalobacteraceae bacterium GrIS 1.11]